MKILTDLEKIEICKLYTEQKLSYKEIGKKYNRTGGAISALVKRRGIKTRIGKLYEIDDTFFEKVDSESKAYILGLLYADGYIDEKRGQCEISLIEEDKYILEKINIYLKTIKPLTYKKPKLHWKTKNLEKPIYRLYIKNKKMCRDLVSLGLRQNKSFTIKFPTEDQVPKFLLRHFIRGIFDGDGCFCAKFNDQGVYHARWDFISSPTFCERFIELFGEEFNLKLSTNANKKYSKPMFSCSINAINKLDKMYDFLYHSLDTDLYLTRKKNKMNKYLIEKGVRLHA